MKLLEYSVAWIDDQPDDVRGNEDRLRGMLVRQGLDLKVERVSTRQALDQFIASLDESSPYDLILVDWKLGMMSQHSGATVAKHVRDAHSHATIIFYSSAKPADLRQEIAKQLIDGVWCVNREHFMLEVKPIVKAALRRIDLNAMRGLFVAAVTEFDHKIKGALLQAHGKLDSKRQGELSASHVGRKIAYLQSQLEALQKLDLGQPFAKVLGDAGTFELVTLLQELNAMGSAVDMAHRHATETLAKYNDEIVMPRNDMAHAKASFDGGRMRLSRGGRTYFTDRFAELRLKLSDHEESLFAICDVYLDRLIEVLKGLDGPSR